MADLHQNPVNQAFGGSILNGTAFQTILTPQVLLFSNSSQVTAALIEELQNPSRNKFYHNILVVQPFHAWQPVMHGTENMSPPQEGVDFKFDPPMSFSDMVQLVQSNRVFTPWLEEHTFAVLDDRSVQDKTVTVHTTPPGHVYQKDWVGCRASFDNAFDLVFCLGNHALRAEMAVKLAVDPEWCTRAEAREWMSGVRRQISDLTVQSQGLH